MARDEVAKSRVRTYSPKASEIERAWHVVDAEGLVLGRLSTEVARILRGKHKPTSPRTSTPATTSSSSTPTRSCSPRARPRRRSSYRHSGYPGGLKRETYAELLARKPEDAVRRPIRGMLPKNRLGRQMLTKLKVYAGPDPPARRPAAAAARARRTPRLADVTERAHRAQAPRPDHRSPQAGRRPRPAPPRHRHDHGQPAARRGLLPVRRRTGWSSPSRCG